jgi:anti-sigma regulatory factor (Ser/Thr protein kinase)
VEVRAVRSFPPDPAVLTAARSFAADRLRALDLVALRDDVQLLLTELVTNVIIHARTAFDVRLERAGDGVRVEVVDGNPTMPAAGTLAPGALSGRGLTLVQSLASRWGAHHNEGAGKTVWFEVNPGSVESPPLGDVEALLAMWDDSADFPPKSDRADALVEVVVPDLPVQRLVAAKAHMEDLLREVQLVLLGNDRRPLGIPRWSALVDIARELDAAAEEFAEGRRQVRLHALEAAARGDELVTLHLHLPPEAAAAAARYGEAVRRAEELGAMGDLLVTAERITEYADIRRRYLEAVIEQLTAHQQGQRPRR